MSYTSLGKVKVQMNTTFKEDLYTHAHLLFNINTNLTSRSLPTPIPLTHTTFNNALLHTCGCKSQWSHISFIKLYFTGTQFWVQPVSIRPQQTQRGSFITIKEVQGAWDRCWNLLVENSLYFDTKHHHYQYFAQWLKYLWCFKRTNNEVNGSTMEQFHLVTDL